MTSVTAERVVLVTGSTDGIGRQTARDLAAAGVRVIVHGRSKPNVDATLAALAAELPGAALDGVAFDLGSLAAVRRGAADLLARFPALHVLVNNAGLFAPERTITADGLELTFAVNHVAAWLLAELLAPRLERVVNVASMAHTRGRIAIDDLAMSRGFTPYGAYATSKLANVMHALSLADRGREAYSLHPGVIGTKLLRQGFGPVRGAALDVGSRTSVRLASAPSAHARHGRPDMGTELAGSIAEPSGTYFNDGVATPPASAARDRAQRDALWEATARLAGT